MAKRKVPLTTGQVYHICNKSIAGFKIFNSNPELSRMKETVSYYLYQNHQSKFSKRKKSGEENNKNAAFLSEKDKLANLVAYCIMPTHIHLILKQLKENGISIFMGNILNSYTRYFNIKHNRKGHLWESEFKNVLVETDEQLLHLTRYIHLNPTTAYLANKPQDWPFSSYREFLFKVEEDNKICDFKDLFDINPVSYRKFVEDLISYQRELEKIKHLLLE